MTSRGTDSGGTDTIGTLRLVSLDGAGLGEYRLGRSHIRVGSAAGNDLVVAHPTVSRQHALIRRRFGRYTIRDLRSTNGTYVNGRKIRSGAVLKPGDEIRFGAVRFAAVGGATGPPRARPRMLRSLGAIAAVAGLFATGFVAAEYAINWNRLEEVAGTQGATVTATPGQKAAAIASARRLAMAKPSAAPPERGAAVTGAEPASPGSGAPGSAVNPASSASTSTSWLGRLNYFRTLAGLAPVVEDAKLSAGDLKHAVYLVKNYGPVMKNGAGVGALVHSEDPSNKWYTPEGLAAAKFSDETEWIPGALDTEGWTIDGWMATPFHRLWILSPLLRRVGYGRYCEAGLCVAMLDVLGGSDRPPEFGAPLKDPVKFPPPDAVIPASMRSFDDEWPSPLSACDGYSYPVGIPATLELGPMVEAKLSSYSIARDGGRELGACGIDAASYRNPDPAQQRRVADVLRKQGAVAIVPRAPLAAGSRYKVSATVNGRLYTWWFTVGG